MQFFNNILGSLWILFLLPTEIKGQCTKPTTSDHAGVHSDDILKDTFDENSSIRLQCHPGYVRSSGSMRLTCSGGQWTPSPESFICKKKSCSNPGEVKNGEYVISDGIEFGAKITALCKTGYTLIGKHITRTCLEDGQWDGREAVCEAVRCGPPPDVTNGLLTLPPNEEYEYGHAVQYKCSDGYTLFGDEDPADTVHCLAEDTWSKKPRCTKVECPRPSIPNAKRIEGSSGPYGHGVRLVYECNVGYRFLPPDNNRMVCLEHGWSHDLTCEEDSSPPPPPPPPPPPRIIIIIAAVVGCACCVAAIVGGIWWWKKKKSRSYTRPMS
ncbi:complement factor H-like [Sardina pilchardus]|uniref:complement factor H-like n=1 Tax=Sardina pilchardus TaxID=27697 RepID=UPI002E116046